MDINLILILAFVAMIYSFIRLCTVFQKRKQRMVLITSAGLLVGVLGFIYNHIIIVFAEGFGRSTLATNWLMGIAFGLILSLGCLAILLLLSDIYILLKQFVIQLKNEAETKKHAAKPIAGRRRFLTRMSLGLAALPFASILYGMWKGKYDFQVRKLSLSFPDLPPAFDGFRLLQFSDIHAGSYDNPKAVREGIQLIQQQNADAIVFTGDWINNFADELDPYMELFQQINASFGKFAILGNHDYSERAEWETEEEYHNNLTQLKGKIEEMGFSQLNNANTSLQKGGSHIRLVGVENWSLPPYPQRGDLETAFRACSEEEFTILLSHDPTHWEEEVLRHDKFVHLTLSGHTHGSQIGLETKWLKWAPIQYVYKRWAGLYKELGRYLYVNRGMGFIGYAGRIGIPPEITVITLNKTTS